MKDFKGATQSEDKMFKAIQRSIGAYDNGWIGCQTMSDLAIKVGADCFPVTLKIYGMPTIIGNDIVLFNPQGSLAKYENSMLGSFTYPRATTPCSIMVNKGKVIWGYSCHQHLMKPESVLYKLSNGSFGIKRCITASELPSNVVWAIGGMGLLDYFNPAAEGFTGQYADVLRKTDHSVVGVKNGMVFGVYMKSVTGHQANNLCRDKFMFDLAIMGDGGGLAAINGAESFAKIRTTIKQGYAVQFI
jgi:hypothetical protein